ncbi:ead/Ea22-like family protein [Erwinia aphidicola]|uniref:ead/Ea22-like family protein n=1 Tax=Erwinia aphidicola TaxID=68334 RepID=UPI0030D59F65
MTEIKRYVPANDDRGEGTVVRNDQSGTVVFYDDHAAIVVAKDARISALQEQVRALAAENSALARYFSTSSVAVNHWNSWADTEDKLACAPETPATDAFIREIRAQARAEGIHFAANRLLAAWESGFVDDTPAAAHDISGAILSAVEFLPNADEAEFRRDYADEVWARIRAGEKS